VVDVTADWCLRRSGNYDSIICDSNRASRITLSLVLQVLAVALDYGPRGAERIPGKIVVENQLA
jgi:hypothetical protein